MPVPTSFADLDTTASLNSPQNTESPKGMVDDYLRSHAALIKQNYVSAESAASTASAAVAKSGDTMTGNLDFSGNSLRIRGDMSNATIASRLMFQTSTTNGATTVGLIPNGTGTTTEINCFNSSDPTSASIASIVAIPTEVRVVSGAAGTGTYLPMTFYTGGSERVRINASGNVGIGATAGNYKLYVQHANTGNFTGVAFNSTSASAADAAGSVRIQIGNSNAGNAILTCANSTGVAFSVDGDGKALAYLPAGLGYGTGAGGTVTQATSKSTAVTLNKPTGMITTHNAVIASGVMVTFTVNNSLVAAGDTVSLNLISGYADITKYSVAAFAVVAGSFQISIKNLSASSTAADALVFQFSIGKGATA